VRPEPTPRGAFAGFMAASLLVLEILGVAHPYTGLSAGFLVVLLVVAYTVTLRSALYLPRVKVERRVPERGVEGARVGVSLSVENRGGPIPVLVVEDVVPKRLRAEGRTWFRLRMEPGDERVLSWHARPAPGYHMLDEVVLAVSDPLGLFEAWTARIVKSSMSVEPLSLGEVEEGAAGRGRAEASWSQLTGHGLEFHHIREYQPGDDVRLIVWTATARAGRPMVRVGIREVELNLNLIVDLSGPSWAGTPGQAAADWIMRSALSLAEASARTGGTLLATLYQGELWWTTGPHRGRESVDVLRRTFSLQGPTRATLRMRMGSVVEKSLINAPPGWPSILLLGPGAPLSRILEAVARARGPVIVAVLAPTGPSALEELVRRVERESVGRVRGEYSRAGVRLLFAETGGEVYAVYREIVKASVLGRVGGR